MTSRPICRQAGMTLIELIMFIVIVSVGIAGILTVLNITVMKSSDPLAQKQAQALAEGLLEEIQTGYFSYCQPGAVANYPKLRYAKSSGECTVPSETPAPVGGWNGGVWDSYNQGPAQGQIRPYDSVRDYASAANTATSISPVLSSEGSVSAPPGYSASVIIGPAALGDITLASGDALLIKVSVSGPGSTQATAEGFKTRQVPQ